MPKSKHTPGPWTTDYYSDRCTVDAAGEFIAVTNDRESFSTGLRTEECQANARLIAAAPEMLASLKEMEQAYLEGSDSEYGNAIMRMRAAIARAEGECARD